MLRLAALLEQRSPAGGRSSATRAPRRTRRPSRSRARHGPDADRGPRGWLPRPHAGRASATGQPSKWEGFGPLLPGIAFAQPNDVESLEAALAPAGGTALILLEPVLGEGGVIPSNRNSRRPQPSSRARGALLCVDEVEAGMGRTGTLLRARALGIRPDLVTLAKGLANGLPIGALSPRSVRRPVLPGDHGSTFGGNPTAAPLDGKRRHRQRLRHDHYPAAHLLPPARQRPFVNAGLAFFLRAQRPRLRRFVGQAAGAVPGYITGNLVISLIAGVTTFVFMTSCFTLSGGMPYAIVLALIVAILRPDPARRRDPRRGHRQSWSASSSSRAGADPVIYFLVYQQIENNVLQPLVYGRSVQLHPLVVFLAVLAGGQLLGILGALLAIPSPRSSRTSWEDWLERRAPAVERALDS